MGRFSDAVIYRARARRNRGPHLHSRELQAQENGRCDATPARQQTRSDLRRAAALLFGAVTLFSSSQAWANGDDDLAAMAVGATILFIVLGLFYFIPAIVALVRGHEFKWVILALNLAVGWTGLGWAAAMVWSVWPKEKSLIDPFVGNPTGLSRRNAGDTMGAYAYGRGRGFNDEHLQYESGYQPIVSNAHLERLERLSDLQKSGAVTQAEFAYHKERLLRGIKS